ncbi:MAG: ABC transporter ATP-binding protein [Mesorhizobium sp.]|uniref:ABC transporter ATP-binding protein n=1 Tax=Mesorhizobium sp. TaxID=1871066 RepID=UPI000FEA53CB|nr:ABC transporter ATP-binding protein [Mesorhizobium sp.]RWD40474.1 MAG: ABC transporter ATP-binding protein [Mesorhizobium sp.]RWE51310.1 MAG: ABC transporter ATP-binding protein [Mesorhizobium sp.]RWF06593.1 MAG: ABC transporter ATP-binding protein [Mesorhizobium sp.]RWF14833.1 MAG: ABC transporter ATP-binding protein [Mesorhizobium sp.]TIY06778.1 MAG: ABC transporter ATP-binding protein [Mesorhizobium sp.]
MTFDNSELPLLEVRNLSVRYLAKTQPLTVVQDVSFDLRRGEILGIIGESGAGKSTVGNAIISLLDPNFEVRGIIRFNGKAIDGANGQELQTFRGREIASIFQDHTASLDPLMTVGAQITETVLAANLKACQRQAKTLAIELMGRVGIPEPDRRYSSYPHQLSGGQRQRIAIAIALAGAPQIIVADEPTSALDATVQMQILRLLRRLVDEEMLSIILVTHDMGVISEIADRVLVMKNGQMVEQNATSSILDSPKCDYTRSLLAAVPRLRLSVNSSQPNLTQQSEEHCQQAIPCARDEQASILAVEGISKVFTARAAQQIFGTSSAKFALQDVSLHLARGTVAGIVGESGSGKTTIGRILAGLETADAGKVTLEGDEYEVSRNGRQNGLLGRVQMIFQDPANSLNPRMTIADALAESLRFGLKTKSHKNALSVGEMMDRTGLPRSLLSRYPHQLSGGQQQRACIARTLLARPKVVIADEPTSALDVSVQSEILALLKECVAEQNLSMFFISHDLAVVQDICSSVYILRNGRVEDFGPSNVIFAQSDNPYTRNLIEARPRRFIQ